MSQLRAARNAKNRAIARTAAVAAFALVLLGAGSARAEWADGLYGRMDGDLHLALDAGPAVDKRGAWGALVGHAHFLDTAGLYVEYVDALGATHSFDRTISFGISIRPLFLPRWGTDLEHGPAILDLTIDSLTFDIGTIWPLPATPSNGESAPLRGPGFELAATFQIPLFGRASGAWLGFRGALRYAAPELAGSPPADQRLGPMAALTVGWREVILTHWIDAGDERSP